MLKILKVKELEKGFKLVVDINKNKLYPFLKALYNEPRGSKKLVERFIEDALKNYVKERK